MTTGGGGAHTYTHIYTHRRKTGHYHQLIKKTRTPRTGRKKWTCPGKRGRLVSLGACMRAHTRTLPHTNTHAHTQRHTQANTHTHTHICTHAHTHAEAVAARHCAAAPPSLVFRYSLNSSTSELRDSERECREMQFFVVDCTLVFCSFV